jgi:ketosteroid isomerase-like protein
MASRNVELVRSIFSGWERGDYSWTDWADPEITFEFADGPTPGSWTGLRGLADAWRDFLEVWEGFRSELDECRQLDADRVLALAHYRGRGKSSRVEIDRISSSAGIFEFRHGKVTKLTFYFDRERALADLGLAPGADTPGS